MLNQKPMIHVVLYIANKLKESGIELSETKLYKLIWFASLYLADTKGDLLLQDIFLKKQYGPVPELLFDYINDIKNSVASADEFIQIKQELKNGISTPYKQNTIEALQPYDENILSPMVIEALDETIKTCGSCNAHSLSKKSHADAWENAIDNQAIDITQDMTNDKYKELVKESYENTVQILTSLRYGF